MVSCTAFTPEIFPAPVRGAATGHGELLEPRDGLARAALGPPTPPGDGHHGPDLSLRGAHPRRICGYGLDPHRDSRKTTVVSETS